jgi:hypothetical protein
MTVYEALVKAQSRECRLIESYFEDFVEAWNKAAWKEVVDGYRQSWQDSIDRAYLLGVAIDNLRADVAVMEV